MLFKVVYGILLALYQSSTVKQVQATHGKFIPRDCIYGDQIGSKLPKQLVLKLNASNWFRSV